MNGSFQSKNLLVFSFVLALMGFGAGFLLVPMIIMLSTDMYGRPGSAPFAILLSIVCLLVVMSWLSALGGVNAATSEADKMSAYGWAASVLVLNGLTCAFILNLVANVWHELDDDGAARVARALVVIASVQFFVALIAAVRQLFVRIQPATSDGPEVLGSELDSE
ncbi:MAG: hypothetical protein OXH53_02435 [bacterium]|nr:hypothetical protein [bacterium]MCY3632209.1 hypothetical protein [bacterium]